MLGNRKDKIKDGKCYFKIHDEDEGWTQTSFSLNRHLHCESQGRQFLAAQQDQAGCGILMPIVILMTEQPREFSSTSKMRISPSTQEMALRHSGKKHHFSLTKNLVFLKLYTGGKVANFIFTVFCFLWWDQLSVLRGNMFLIVLLMAPVSSSQTRAASILGCSSVLDTGKHQILWRNIPLAQP